MHRRYFLKVPLAAPVVLFASLLSHSAMSGSPDALSTVELQRASQFHISNLALSPPDISNAISENADAIELGRQLFFDEAMSSNNSVSCATCHIPENGFQDNKAVGEGVARGVRRTMPIAGAQWSPWFFWDGRKDSLWSQALGPLEDRKEHGATRAQLAKYVLSNYLDQYQSIFDNSAPHTASWPDIASPLVPGLAAENWNQLSSQGQHDINVVFANIGKVIAAYERTIRPNENRFDRYIAASLNTHPIDDNSAMSSEEIAGFRLFSGKAQCSTCHTGPRFTDDFFHNTGIPTPLGKVPDLGRYKVISQVLSDPFNCAGIYSDAGADSCAELKYMQTNARQFIGAFKTPSLRAVSQRSPYMHAGQIKTLEDVIEHYSRAGDALSGSLSNFNVKNGRVSELTPLNLNDAEKRQLVAFLKTL
ncbi:cytochrome c peroxidase [Pontibacterium granulatum]|uniref:cytochrome-c peroxidase n=1 Tax=Pontibacterium granulatum TaxID=2036029 RepID=UPI00249B3392|nr:cytochrome c peroxidase [Pontibacterium granulatum]MDI3326175.1 cytochrome c peroxidase [Pontibacterium granulatum]